MKYIIIIALTLIIPLSGNALTNEEIKVKIAELYQLVYQLQAQLLELQQQEKAEPVEEPVEEVIEEPEEEIVEEPEEEVKPQQRREILDWDKFLKENRGKMTIVPVI